MSNLTKVGFSIHSGLNVMSFSTSVLHMIMCRLTIPTNTVLGMDKIIIYMFAHLYLLILPKLMLLILPKSMLFYIFTKMLPLSSFICRQPLIVLISVNMLYNLKLHF